MHNYLIEKTHGIHTALHTNPALKQLLNKELTGENYARVLVCYYRFIATIENYRHKTDSWPQFSLTSELNFLADDLENLDINPSTLTKLTLEWIENRYQLLGALYVFHGSKAGSNIISSAIKKHNPDLPQRFLSSQINEQQWKILLFTINEISENSESGQLLTESAIETFRQFDIHLKN